jgi:DNA-binding transcriptional ArsR family regulator
VDYRKQMVDARVESIGKPGVNLDTGPTGCGKTYACIEVYQLVDRALNLQKTHANCQEEAEKLQAAGLDAKAIPQMNKYTCENWPEADNAFQSGISAAAAVCPTCRFNSTCSHLAEKKEAHAAAITIVTHALAAKPSKLDALVDGRKLMVLEEDATDFFRPTLSVNPNHLNRVADVFSEAYWRAKPKDKKEADTALCEFLEKAGARAEEFSDGCLAAKTTRTVTMPAPMEKPKNLEWHLWRVVKDKPVDPKAMQLMLGILTGSVDRLVVKVDRPFIIDGGRERESIVTLVGSSRTKLPQNIPIWNQDATGDAKAIGDLVGQAVNDCTPKGRLANQKAIKQYPIDFTQKTKPARVAAYLEGWMQSNQNAQKAGIILHKAMRTALFGPRSKQHPEEYLTEATKKRINVDVDGERLVTHFGSGLDRASNQWLDSGCDVLLILGTYRVNPIADGNVLIQFGKITAAADSNQGGWSRLRRWEGRTAAGKKIQVDGCGYSDPDWRKAREHTCRSTLLQAIGRGRGILDAGIPVHIFSTEPLGPDVELVDPADMQMLKRATLEAVETLRHCCRTLITTDIGEMQQPAPVQTRLIAAELGVSKSTATRRLQAAQEAGLVTRSDKRKGGWLPVPLREHTIREAPADPQKIPRPPRTPAPPQENENASKFKVVKFTTLNTADLQPADTS